MIPSITYEDIIRKLRPKISEQTGIPLDRIHNAVSVRGADLYKLISETESMSYSLGDVFIVFELVEETDELNTVLHEVDESISSIACFNFNLKIYGNACHQVSQEILMRFKTEDVAFNMRNEGIFIRGISFPTSINEFINNTVWPRCDMSIKIAVRFNTNPVIPTVDAEGIGKIILHPF